MISALRNSDTDRIAECNVPQDIPPPGILSRAIDVILNQISDRRINIGVVKLSRN
jgi:hypothetical protein